MVSELSTVNIVAVPSSADSFTRIALYSVPQGKKRVKAIHIMLAPDHGTAAISVRSAPIIRLQGDGLGEQSPHDYVGPFGGVAVTTDGTMVQENVNVDYEVDIPVVPGGEIEVLVNTLDEAITAGTVLVALIYDDDAPKANNSMAQTTDAALDTTADRFSNVGTVRIPLPEAAKAPKKIIAIIIGVAVDNGTSAVSLRGGVRIRMTGDGLKEAGDHEYLAKGFTEGRVTVGSIAFSNLTKVIKVDLDINAGGSVLVEQRVEVETPTAGTIAVGFIYA